MYHIVVVLTRYVIHLAQALYLSIQYFASKKIFNFFLREFQLSKIVPVKLTETHISLNFTSLNTILPH